MPVSFLSAFVLFTLKISGLCLYFLTARDGVYEDVDVVVFVCTRNKNVYFYKIIIILVKIKIFTNFSGFFFD